MKPDGEPQDPEGASENSTARTVTDALRRVLLGGVGNLLASEEALRGAVRDLRLPKELVTTLLGQAESTKEEVVQALRRELRGFLSSMDAQTLMQKALTGLVLELKAEVRFRPDENGTLVPDVRVGSSARSSREPAKPAPRKPARRKRRSADS
jgi:hypothetical protein